MSGSTARRGLVTMLLVGALLTAVNVPSASAEVTAVGGGAFGIGGSVAVAGSPPVRVQPYPAVNLPPDGGGPFTASGGAFDVVVVANERLTVETWGQVNSGDGFSNADSWAEANNVSVLTTFQSPPVTATKIRSECGVSHREPTGASASSGSTILTKAEVLDRPLEEAPEPNTVIDVAPGVTLHLDERIRRNLPRRRDRHHRQRAPPEHRHPHGRSG